MSPEHPEKIRPRYNLGFGPPLCVSCSSNLRSLLPVFCEVNPTFATRKLDFMEAKVAWVEATRATTRKNGH